MIELIVDILPHVLPFSTLPFIIIHHIHIKITDICGNEWMCSSGVNLTPLLLLYDFIFSHKLLLVHLKYDSNGGS